MENEDDIQKLHKKGFFNPQYKNDNPDIDWATLELQNKEIYKQNLKLERLAEETYLSKIIQQQAIRKLKQEGKYF